MGNIINCSLFCSGCTCKRFRFPIWLVYFRFGLYHSTSTVGSHRAQLSKRSELLHPPICVDPEAIVARSDGGFARWMVKPLAQKIPCPFISQRELWWAVLHARLWVPHRRPSCFGPRLACVVCHDEDVAVLGWKSEGCPIPHPFVTRSRKAAPVLRFDA